MLVSNHNGKLVATHLPFLLDRENGCLSGHLAKTNTQWEDILNQEVLVVFQGAHSYISSSWYETNLSVPTWNYMVVHVYGRISLVEDRKGLWTDLKEMVEKYEAPDSTYQIDDSNRAFVEGMMKGLVGFKLKIHRLEGKWKLSQNYSRERQERIVMNLKQRNSDYAREIANAMERNIK